MLHEIINQTKGIVVSHRAKAADNFFKRLIGLMFKKSLDKDEALIFKGAPSIHTFFMRFPIDVVFLDREMRVIRICKELKPWRGVFCKDSFLTLEFPPLKVSEDTLRLGDFLKLSPPLP